MAILLWFGVSVLAVSFGVLAVTEQPHDVVDWILFILVPTIFACGVVLLASNLVGPDIFSGGFAPLIPHI